MDQEQIPSQPLLRCMFCEWTGGDVVEFPTNDGPKPICQSCLVVANIGVDKLGMAHPGVLVPLIRSCVAQSVSVMMAGFIEKLIQALGACAEQGMTLAEKSALIQSVADAMKTDHN